LRRSARALRRSARAAQRLLVRCKTRSSWPGDDRDSLVRENGRVATFPSLAELHAYALQNGLEVQPAAVVRYDWDSIEGWCGEPAASGIAVGPFLNAWNMVLDTLPACDESSVFLQAHSRNGDLYEKLFRANNLPSMTPPGAEYYPVWTRAEVDALAQVLRLGITEVRDQLAG
jgi:hypothetical protein